MFCIKYLVIDCVHNLLKGYVSEKYETNFIVYKNIVLTTLLIILILLKCNPRLR